MVKDIPGYDGFYRISDRGDVFSCHVRGFADRRGKWKRRKPDVVYDGHFQITLSLRGETRRFYVHALVLITFVGPRPEGMQCRHLDGNPANNYVLNLEWNTQTVNQRDRDKHGTRNARSPKARAALEKRRMEGTWAKLDADKVRMVRRLSSLGWTAIEIAEWADVHYQTIRAVLTGRRWSHVT